MEFAKYVKLRQDKFGAVVFDTLNEKVFITNETGKEILSLMADGLDVSSIAQSLGGNYEEDSSGIEADVAEFINNLESAGLLVSSTEEKV